MHPSKLDSIGNIEFRLFIIEAATLRAIWNLIQAIILSLSVGVLTNCLFIEAGGWSFFCFCSIDDHFWIASCLLNQSYLTAAQIPRTHRSACFAIRKYPTTTTDGLPSSPIYRRRIFIELGELRECFHWVSHSIRVDLDFFVFGKNWFLFCISSIFSNGTYIHTIFWFKIRVTFFAIGWRLPPPMKEIKYIILKSRSTPLLPSFGQGPPSLGLFQNVAPGARTVQAKL